MTSEDSARRIALVTGAATGIGRSVALALAKDQWTVVMAGRRHQPLEKAAREGGARCIPMQCDVSNETSVDALFSRIEAEIGRLDPGNRSSTPTSRVHSSAPGLPSG
jgi:NAD(P)-dependent dehydrogenase (short-subunit alcohol dehydrogenase family)